MKRRTPCVLVHVRDGCVRVFVLLLFTAAIEDIPLNLQFCRVLRVLELSSNPLLRCVCVCVCYFSVLGMARGDSGSYCLVVVLARAFMIEDIALFQVSPDFTVSSYLALLSVFDF